MKLHGLFILAAFSLPALAQQEASGGVRVQYAVKVSECANLQTQEIEVREKTKRGDPKSFVRRHEHVTYCEALVPSVPQYHPTILQRQRGGFMILQINGSRVRFAVTRKCYAYETLTYANPTGVDPAFADANKIAQESCQAQAKEILENNSELKLDFDVKEAE